MAEQVRRRATDALAQMAESWIELMGKLKAARIAHGDHGHVLEVVAGSRGGLLFAWHTKGREGGVIAWESAYHDNANTGDYGRKLAQGATKRASAPAR